MANFSSLISAILSVIKQNGNNEITGILLQQTLLAMVNSLGFGYNYYGIATPTTNPGTPDQNIFYIAFEPGIYVNFNRTVVNEGEIAILKYNGDWIKDITGAASFAYVEQVIAEMNTKINGLSLGKFYGFFADETDLPSGDLPGFAYVGSGSPFSIYVFNNDEWSNSGSVYEPPVGNGEDIDTDENGELQFANRDAINGLGYFIVRKEKTFVSQITEQNTIYEIRYNFDLGGNSVTIPTGCVLKFTGGMLYNGTIVGQKTNIVADLTQIFGTDLTLSGSWLTNEIYPEWYGAKSDNIVDDALPIRCCLNSPIVVTKLQDKPYYLKSYVTQLWDVNNIDVNCCIVIPTDKIIKGCGTSDYMTYSRLVVGVSVDVGVYINGRNIICEKIAIAGTQIGSVFSCNRLFCSKKGTAKLSFKDVYARYCNNNAFDIDAYMSVFIQCGASDCGGIGFYFHAAAGHNTTIDLINCSTGTCKRNGFLLHNLDYCNLTCCSSDACGYDGENIDLNNIHHPYELMGCRGITFNGCGCEANFTIFKADTDTKGVSINGCYFQLKNKSEYPSEFDYSKIFEFGWITRTTISDTLIGRQLPKLVSATANTNVTFVNCYVYGENDTETAQIEGLTQDLVSYSDGAIENGVVFVNRVLDKIGTVTAGVYDGILQRLNNSDLQETSIINTTHGYISDKVFRNIHGTVIFANATTWTRVMQYVGGKDIFRNCAQLIFTDTNFDMQSFNPNNFDCVFELENTKIKFVNCQFTSFPTSIPVWKLKNNSHIEFVNCVFLNYNDSIDALMSIDSTSSFDVEPSFGNGDVEKSVRKKGKLFYNESSGKVRVYTGTGWINVDGS